jgi:hypothetical protein
MTGEVARGIQQPDGGVDGRRAHVHVALRSRQVLMASQFLNCPSARSPHGEMRTECMAQHVNADTSQVGSTRCSRHKTLNQSLPQRSAVGCTEHPIMPVFDKACRYIASHSQPPETQGIRPTLAELKADYDGVAKAWAPHKT